MKTQPVNIASREITAAIERIEPSQPDPGYLVRPCSLGLDDGRTVERALCQVNARYSDKGAWINPQRIVSITETRFRLPPQLANKLYRAGESGMGYVIYILRLRSGDDLVCASGGIVDFPDLPDGVTTADIIDLLPHKGRERSISEGYRSDADFEWCDYVPWDDT